MIYQLMLNSRKRVYFNKWGMERQIPFFAFDIRFILCYKLFLPGSGDKSQEISRDGCRPGEMSIQNKNSSLHQAINILLFGVENEFI